MGFKTISFLKVNNKTMLQKLSNTDRSLIANDAIKLKLKKLENCFDFMVRWEYGMCKLCK